jgi:hypothetical protein
VVVTLAKFKASVTKQVPPPDLAPPVQALWWAAKGDWDKAHSIVMKDESLEAAWVHAYLHRVEGDLANAGYWYRRAGKTVATGALETEWEQMVSALLNPVSGSI